MSGGSKKREEEPSGASCAMRSKADKDDKGPTGKTIKDMVAGAEDLDDNTPIVKRKKFKQSYHSATAHEKDGAGPGSKDVAVGQKMDRRSEKEMDDNVPLLLKKSKKSLDGEPNLCDTNGDTPGEKRPKSVMLDDKDGVTNVDRDKKAVAADVASGLAHGSDGVD